jgi:hypothetical protein
MSEQLQAARWQVSNLTYQELLALRDDLAHLLAAYEAGGALTGRGSIELKVIKRPIIAKTTDEQGNITLEPRMIDCGPYAYIRRWAIDENGRVSLTSSGYYGRGGAEAVEAGLGEQLLEAHLRGGEPAGDEFLEENGFDPPLRRSVSNKPPASPPVHPLGDAAITSETLTASPIFTHYQQYAPTIAARLLRELRQYEADLANYQYAEKHGLIFRLNNEMLTARRKRAARRHSGQPPRRIRRSSS